MKHARTALALTLALGSLAIGTLSPPETDEVIAVEVVALTQEVVKVYTTGLVQGAGSSACYATPLYETVDGKKYLKALRCDATKKCDGPCGVSKGPVQPNGNQLIWCNCGGN
jgi:hypothetical protein